MRKRLTFRTKATQYNVHNKLKIHLFKVNFFNYRSDFGCNDRFKIGLDVYVLNRLKLIQNSALALFCYSSNILKKE